MKETRKQKDMFVKIPDNFREQGLTLEHAYIYWRVARFNDGGLPYYESNKTLAEIMGKSESTVKRYIDELVKEGHLYRKTRTRKRLLSIKPFNYEGQNEPYESNKSIGESSIRFKMNPYEYQNEPYEGFKMNYYKDNRIDKRIEETQNTKNRSTDLNNLTPEEKQEYLQELLDNKEFKHDEEFY